MRAVTGRLVLAGDPLQLPPIMHVGDALAADRVLADEAPLHSSILDCLVRDECGNGKRGGRGGDTTLRFHAHVCKLLDNFRMNARLAHFTQALYGDDYVCSARGTRRDQTLPSVGARDGVRDDAGMRRLVLTFLSDLVLHPTYSG